MQQAGKSLILPWRVAAHRRSGACTTSRQAQVGRRGDANLVLHARAVAPKLGRGRYNLLHAVQCVETEVKLTALVIRFTASNVIVVKLIAWVGQLTELRWCCDSVPCSLFVLPAKLRRQVRDPEGCSRIIRMILRKTVKSSVLHTVLRSAWWPPIIGCPTILTLTPPPL